MTSFADDFRAEAVRRQGEVINRKLRGWSFCLSYGAVDATKVAQELEESGRPVRHGFRDITRKVLDRLRKQKPEDLAVAQEILRGEWMLSAKLFPPGRSSTESDWRFLGEMLGALHVPDPEHSIVTPIEKTHPNATHYWKWQDPN